MAGDCIFCDMQIFGQIFGHIPKLQSYGSTFYKSNDLQCHDICILCDDAFEKVIAMPNRMINII